MNISSITKQLMNLSEQAFESAKEMDLNRLEDIQSELNKAIAQLTRINLCENDKAEIVKTIEIYDNICSVLDENRLKLKDQIISIQAGKLANIEYLSNQNRYN